MTFTEALRALSPYTPCPHDAYDDSLGYGGVWAKCHDCGVTFEVERHDRSRRSNQAFSEALDVLKHQAETLDAIRDALGNGADEEAWPVGLTLPEAVARLRAMRRESNFLRAAEREVEELRVITARLAATLRQGDFALAEHAGFVTVPRDVLDKLHDHYCGPERSDPVADPLWAELGRYIDGKGRKP